MSQDRKLISEAKKFKTSEDFIESQGIQAYHGTSKAFDKFDQSKAGSNLGLDTFGIFFTTKKDRAHFFSSDYPFKPSYRFTEEDKAAAKKAISMVKEVRLDTRNSLSLDDVVELYENGKIKTKPTTEGLFRAESAFDNNRESIKEALEVTGKNVFKFTAEGETQYAVIDTDVIKTIEELKKAWSSVNP